MTNDQKQEVKRLKDMGQSMIEILKVFRDRGIDIQKDDMKQTYLSV